MRLILVLMVLLVGGCQLGPTFANPIEGTVLEKHPGFTCTLPSGWVKDDLGPNVDNGSIWRDTQDVAKLELAYSKLRFPFDEMMKGRAQRLSSDKSVKDFKLEKEGTLSLAGAPAHEIIYTATINGRARWRREIYAVKGEKLVLILFLANLGQQDAFAKDFQGILDSWKWE